MMEARVCDFCGKGFQPKSSASKRCGPCQPLAKQMYHKGWLAENRDAAYRREQHLRIKYGITTELYELMLKVQEGCCNICGELLKKPCVDHCHVTQTVRGILCDNCNKGLGYFRDSPDNLLAALYYILVRGCGEHNETTSDISWPRVVALLRDTGAKAEGAHD